MAYDVRWDKTNPQWSIDEAHKRAKFWVPEGAKDLGHLYRFTMAVYSVSNEDGDHDHTRYQLELEAFAIKKRTKCGVTLWVKWGARHKFVNFSHTREFASLTIAQALESYMAKKKRQAAIYQARRDHAIWAGSEAMWALAEYKHQTKKDHHESFII